MFESLSVTPPRMRPIRSMGSIMMASRLLSAIRAFSEGRPHGRLPTPIRQLQRRLVARQHYLRFFIKQSSHPPVTPLGDAAGVIDFARLTETSARIFLFALWC
jgi:hypothetical protein